MLKFTFFVCKFSFFVINFWLHLKIFFLLLKIEIRTQRNNFIIVFSKSHRYDTHLWCLWDPTKNYFVSLVFIKNSTRSAIIWTPSFPSPHLRYYLMTHLKYTSFRPFMMNFERSTILMTWLIEASAIRVVKWRTILWTNHHLSDIFFSAIHHFLGKWFEYWMWPKNDLTTWPNSHIWISFCNL